MTSDHLVESLGEDPIAMNRAGFAGRSNSCVRRNIMNKTTNRYSPEICERAVQMVLNNEDQRESRWSATCYEIGLMPAVTIGVCLALACGGRLLSTLIFRCGVPTTAAQGLRTLSVC